MTGSWASLFGSPTDTLDELKESVVAFDVKETPELASWEVEDVDEQVLFDSSKRWVNFLAFRPSLDKENSTLIIITNPLLYTQEKK